MDPTLNNVSCQVLAEWLMRVTIHFKISFLHGFESCTLIFQTSSRLVRESFETSYHAKKLVCKSFPPSKTTRLATRFWGFLLGFYQITRHSSIVNSTTLVLGKTSNFY